MDAFAVVWGALLLAPPGAAAVIHAADRSRRGLNRILTVATAVVGLVLFAGFAGLSFTGASYNVAAVLVAYAAYCLLVFATGRIRRPLIRWPVQIIGCVPILVGYVLATIGFLGLSFIVGDAVQPPDHTATSGGLVCQVTPWGGPVGDSGYTISVYRYWRPLPIRHRLVELQVDESTRDRDASCADGFKAALS